MQRGDGGGGIDIVIKVKVKVLSFLVVADLRGALLVQLDIEIEKVKVVADLLDQKQKYFD